MSATGRVEIRLLRPVEDITGDDDLEREGRYEPAGTLMASVIPIRAERAIHSLGVLTDRAVKMRFQAPDLEATVQGGWRIEAEGETYEVRAATQMQGSYNVTAERI